MLQDNKSKIKKLHFYIAEISRLLFLMLVLIYLLLQAIKTLFPFSLGLQLSQLNSPQWILSLCAFGGLAILFSKKKYFTQQNSKKDCMLPLCISILFGMLIGIILYMTWQSRFLLLISFTTGLIVMMVVYVIILYIFTYPKLIETKEEGISTMYQFGKKHKYVLGSILFNIVRPFSYIRMPTYTLSFGYGLCVIRAALWSSRFRKMGKNVLIDSGVIIRGNARNLEIDDFSYIDTNVQLEIYERLKIGKHVHIANNVHIQSGDEIVIGDFAAIASGSRVYSSSNTYKQSEIIEKQILLSMSASAPPELQRIKKSRIVIEDYAFIGLNCVVLPGVNVGKGAIVGAGSVVTKDVPPYSIAVGIPAKVVGYRPHPLT